METPILKSVSNVKLLDMYYDYRNELKRYVKVIDTAKKQKDKTTQDYYEEKLSRDCEYFFQIRNEILSRMMGMEID